MTLIKAKMVDLIREEIGFTRKESFEIVETLLEIIKTTLESGLQHSRYTATCC